MPVRPLAPESCDIFVVLPPGTAQDCVIFGKNSDRPKGEVQEVVYFSAADHSAPSNLECTYISIEQVEHTHAVILSKPAWMWGAEMGANECGVCIGNVAVWTNVSGPEDEEEKLLGMDLVRLGLERSSTAEEAVDVISNLLETHGQGGPCSDTIPDLTYHNSFLIVDCKEAWVLESAGTLWAAERVTEGARNISNFLSIGQKIDLMSKDLKEHAQLNCFWDPDQGEFDFAAAYGKQSENGTERFSKGKELVEKLSAGAEFDTLSMFEVLRDCDSGICRGLEHEFPTSGSQVSVLWPSASSRSCCHWFTGTPDPKHSVFKPFVFCTTNRISRHIISPSLPDNEDPAKVKPRFQTTADRSHLLYRKHQKAYSVLVSDSVKGQEINSVLRRLETQCVKDMETFVENFTPDKANEVEDLFKDLVESEMKFYQ